MGHYGLITPSVIWLYVEDPNVEHYGLITPTVIWPYGQDPDAALWLDYTNCNMAIW